MLFSGIVHEDIEFTKLIYRLLYSLLANVAMSPAIYGAATVVPHQLFRLFGRRVRLST